MIIDVSQWQGSIDWQAVKGAGITRAVAKATEGIGFTDPNFHANWQAMAAAGMPRGAYHFARPDTGNDPIAEADWFLSVVQLAPGDWLADDYEVVGGGAAWNLAFLGRIKVQTGISSLFYSNYSGCSRVASGGAAMAAYALWLAYPGTPGSPPQVPPPWSSIALWQYGTGTIPGISGRVDEDTPLSLFGGTLGQMGMTGTTHSEDSNLSILAHPTELNRFDVLVIASDGLNVIHGWGTSDALRNGTAPWQNWGGPPGGGTWAAGSLSASYSNNPDIRIIFTCMRASDGWVFVKEIANSGVVVRDWMPLQQTEVGALYPINALLAPNVTPDVDVAPFDPAPLKAEIDGAVSTAASAQAAANAAQANANAALAAAQAAAQVAAGAADAVNKIHIPTTATIDGPIPVRLN